MGALFFEYLNSLVGPGVEGQAKYLEKCSLFAAETRRVGMTTDPVREFVGWNPSRADRRSTNSAPKLVELFRGRTGAKPALIEAVHPAGPKRSLAIRKSSLRAILISRKIRLGGARGEDCRAGPDFLAATSAPSTFGRKPGPERNRRRQLSCEYSQNAPLLLGARRFSKLACANAGGRMPTKIP